MLDSDAMTYLVNRPDELEVVRAVAQAELLRLLVKHVQDDELVIRLFARGPTRPLRRGRCTRSRPPE